jgi:hypothetical protein
VFSSGCTSETNSLLMQYRWVLDLKHYWKIWIWMNLKTFMMIDFLKWFITRLESQSGWLPWKLSILVWTLQNLKFWNLKFESMQLYNHVTMQSCTQKVIWLTLNSANVPRPSDHEAMLFITSDSHTSHFYIPNILQYINHYRTDDYKMFHNDLDSRPSRLNWISPLLHH